MPANAQVTYTNVIWSALKCDAIRQAPKILALCRHYLTGKHPAFQTKNHAFL